MIVKLSVATSRLIEECKIQTSLDFQAMRSRGVENVDAVYDDWIITDEDDEEIYYALQDICTDMAFSLRTLIKTYSAGKDIITIDIVSNKEEISLIVVLEGIMRKYLKYSILAWWYKYRDDSLYTSNATEASTALNNLFSQCVPRTGRIIPRYF